MAPLEPWEKVLVSTEFTTSTHGALSCILCHGGEQDPDKDTAHTGLIADPSADAQGQCSTCHADVTEGFSQSLHATLNGYTVSMTARSIPENHPALEEAFTNHCASCHTTCGNCHISQPNSVGGGLLSGHLVEKTPPMTRTCTACHGSRVGAEYLGQHEEIPGDVHFREGRMNCVTCHQGADLHSTPEDATGNRYYGEQTPQCKECHDQVGASGDPIAYHTLHNDKLSCQVCHSVEYTSCDGCHVAISETSGSAFFKTDGTYLNFLIGKNPLQSEARPYEYVTVRHVPISEDSFAYYGDNLLPNYALQPTWRYATPHNIQRNTPQTATCNTCHSNPDYFLTADKVKPGELEANKDVIIQDLPKAMPGN